MFFFLVDFLCFLLELVWFAFELALQAMVFTGVVVILLYFGYVAFRLGQLNPINF